MRVESAVEPHCKRVHAFSQSMLQIMNVGATWQTADRFTKTIVIVMQQGQALSQTQECRLIGGLRHVEVVLVLSNGNLESVKPSYKPPHKCSSARSDRGQSGDGPLKKAPRRAFRWIY